MCRNSEWVVFYVLVGISERYIGSSVPDESEWLLEIAGRDFKRVDME
jgi:hypothetical protein